MKLVIENLTKEYGENLVLDDVSFTFESGKIYGLLGRNGSGKTTFFNCLDGLIQYKKGKFFIENEDKSTEQLDSNNIGFVLTNPMLPEFLTGYEFIKTYMEINKIDEIDKINEYFEKVSLDKKDQDKLIKDYSSGMKNKVQILMCIISKPKVILLDEPLTSIDVVVAKEIKDIFKSLKKDHIIIFSTHILELATSMCDEIAIINNKKIEQVDSKIIKSSSFENKIVEILTNEKWY